MADYREFCSFTDVGGIKTRYIKKGRGKNLLLIPGWRCDIERVSGMIDFFSDHFTVYCVDFPGHGGTEKLQGKHTLKSIGLFIKRWAKKVQLKDFHVVAASMGAPIALYFLSSFPDKEEVNNLYLLAPWTSKETLKYRKLYLNFLTKVAKKATRSKFFKKLGRKTFRATKVLKFFISIVERREVKKGVDITFFAESWKRFDFDVCMETFYDTLLTDIRKLDIRFPDKRTYLIMSKGDPYINFSKTYLAYRRIFPNLTPIYLSHAFHAPRVEITKKYCEDNFNRVICKITGR